MGTTSLEEHRLHQDEQGAAKMKAWISSDKLFGNQAKHRRSEHQQGELHELEAWREEVVKSN